MRPSRWTGRGRFWSAWASHLADPALRRTFAIGFLILFGFIGVFTYVGFVLMRPPHAPVDDRARPGLPGVPAVDGDDAAGRERRPAASDRASPAPASLALALGGLALMLLPSLAAIIAGMTLVGIGTFFAQAVATGHVGRIAAGDKAAASGLYLSSYYCGGLAGAAVDRPAVRPLRLAGRDRRRVRGAWRLRPLLGLGLASGGQCNE